MKLKPSILFLALLCPTLSLSAWAEPYQATITTNTATGSVKYELPGASSFTDLAWKDTAKLPPGTVVETTGDGVGILSIFPGGRVLVMPNSSFKIASAKVDTAGDTVTKRQAKLSLKTGVLKTLLSHTGGNTSPINFSIQTPTGVAAARGTKYITAVVNGVTYVELIDGTVDVNGTLVTAGQTAEITPNGTVELVDLNELPPGVIQALTNAVETTVDGGTPQVNARDGNGSDHTN